MRILVTNDDGVSAPGLEVAEGVARKVAEARGGDKAEVWTVAPAFEQSGVSHAISFNRPLQVQKVGERRFAVQGTPADCVLVALYGMMKDSPPDLVISGVNRGHNIGEDAVYSGTVGGAIEGAFHGYKSIALSQYFRIGANQKLLPPEQMFDAAAVHGPEAVLQLLDLEWEKDLFFNVNFPPVAAADAKPMRFAPQGRRANGGFFAEERESPRGARYYWLTYNHDNLSMAAEEDGHLCAKGWITAVPMKPHYTDVAMLKRLQDG